MKHDPRLLFPAWLEKGPWPYEAGIAMLLIWLAECVRNVDATQSTYSPRFQLGPFLSRHDDAAIALCLVGAAFLISGLASVAFHSVEAARPFRVIGLTVACIVFAIISYGFHAAWTYSLGGGAYLLLTWRTFCVAVHIAKEGRGVGAK